MMKCCMCGKETTNLFEDNEGNLYCSESCFEESMPKCIVCKNRLRNVNSLALRGFCSKECLSIGNRLNLWLKTVVVYPKSFYDKLNMSNNVKKILQGYCSNKTIYVNVFELCKQQKLLSERELAISLSRVIKINKVSKVENGGEPGFFSSEADLKIYGYKKAALDANLEFVRNLFEMSYKYDSVLDERDELKVDAKKAFRMRDNLQELLNRMLKEREILIAKLVKPKLQNQEYNDNLKFKSDNFYSSYANGNFGIFMWIAQLSELMGLFEKIVNRKDYYIKLGEFEAKKDFAKKMDDAHKKFDEAICGIQKADQQILEAIVNLQFTIELLKQEINLLKNDN